VTAKKKCDSVIVPFPALDGTNFAMTETEGEVQKQAVGKLGAV
jgi:hypothetical protein